MHRCLSLSIWLVRRLNVAVTGDSMLTVTSCPYEKNDVECDDKKIDFWDA